MEVIVVIIAGLFALLSAFLAWRLGEASSKSTLAKEVRREREELYANVYTAFERAISEIRNHKERTSVDDFFRLTPRISLLAPKEISERYFECCHRLKEWSEIYVRAYPNDGFVRVPDPAATFKEPEKELSMGLIQDLGLLVDAMRLDLDHKP
jgi:hypothetical protein